MIPLYEVSKIVRLPEAENRMAVAREWGEGEIEKLMFNVYKVTPQKITPQIYIHITLIKVKERKKKNFRKWCFAKSTWEKKTA